MSEGNRFVVEVVGRLQEAHEVTVSRVSSALGLDEARAAALVARMPGVITKPAGEDRAMKIALRLQEAGVPALHRPLAEHEDPFKTAERPVRVVAPEPAAAAAPVPAAATPATPTPRPDAPALVPEEPEAAPVAPQLALEPEPEPPAVPRDVPSLDATHHDGERDPKLTPMTEAGFGAADIVIPTMPSGDRSRPRATFVEAGSTATPAPDADDPARTMVRPPSDQPTPAPGGTPLPEVALRAGGDAPRERPLTPVGPALAAKPAARGAAPGGARKDAEAGARKDAEAGARSTAPAYRQTRSAAEPPLTLSAPPEDVLKRSGVPEPELPSQSLRRRGRFGRHLAAQVALPGLLTWSLTAVALWWVLGSDRSELFVVLAAATAVAALIGSLIAALGTIGVSRDVLRLRDEARRIAMGELTAPVGSNRDDELGEIAGSLERMRLSLQEGLERLRKRTKA